MKRSSTATWQGSGREGKGTVTSQSKAVNNAPYAWNSRYAEAKGTNPEELLAAAHASCFTMKLSFLISDAGYVAQEIKTTSTVTLEENNITESHLVVKARIPGISQQLYLAYAEEAKNECPMSKAIKIKITMDATLEVPVEKISAVN